MLEEMEWLTPQCQRFLKDALDPAGSMPRNLVVVATSNGARGLWALRLGFLLLGRSNVRAACQEGWPRSGPPRHQAAICRLVAMLGPAG